MTNTAALHQGSIVMYWLHFWGAVMSVVYVDMQSMISNMAVDSISVIIVFYYMKTRLHTAAPHYHSHQENWPQGKWQFAEEGD